MTPQSLVVHYQVLLVLDIDWELSLEEAAVSVQSDLAPIILDSESGAGAFLHFLLYPANAHKVIADGDYIESFIASINPLPSARIVLAACAPTYPLLPDGAVSELAISHLSKFQRKNAFVATETDILKAKAEVQIRHSLSQLGISSPRQSLGSAKASGDFSLLRIEADTWRT